MNRGWASRTILALGLTQPASAAAGQAVMPREPERSRPSVVAIRTVDPIRLDGRLDEETWRRATAATGFTQREPDEGRPSLERTEVRVAYDEHALYVGITCFLSGPFGIKARSYRRDFSPITAGDYVGFVIDAMGDGNGFGFETNPLGAQGDWQFTG